MCSSRIDDRDSLPMLAASVSIPASIAFPKDFPRATILPVLVYWDGCVVSLFRFEINGFWE